MDLFVADHSLSGPGPGLPPSSEPQVMELSLHLPGWQVSALENLARQRGLTTGQLLRRLIGNLLQEQAAK